MVEIFTTSTCPKCKTLKNKLKDKNIEYKENQDINEMIKLGITEVPKLMVDGELLGFDKAISWANKF